MHPNSLSVTLLILSLTSLLQSCTAYQNYIDERNAQIRRNQIALAHRTCQSELQQTAINSAINGQNSTSALQYYQNYCAEYELKPDPQIWQAGYVQGNQQYCQLMQAYENGKKQLTFNPQLCNKLSVNARNTRVDANRYGLEMARQQSTVQQLRQDLDTSKFDLRTSQNQLDKLEKENNHSEIKRLQSLIQQQQREVARIQDQIDTRQTQLRKADLDYRNQLLLKEQAKA
jgi:hypothetical protein